MTNTMKKTLTILLAILLGMQLGLAQDITAEGIKFRDSMMQYLREEGYAPKIDTDESVMFKKEGKQYWFTIEESGPFYVELHVTGFDMDNVDLTTIMEACNAANAQTRCGKACVKSSSVILTVEVYVKDAQEFQAIFNRSMNALGTLKDKVKSYYNEHSE